MFNVSLFFNFFLHTLFQFLHTIEESDCIQLSKSVTQNSVTMDLHPKIPLPPSRTGRRTV